MAKKQPKRAQKSEPQTFPTEEFTKKCQSYRIKFLQFRKQRKQIGRKNLQRYQIRRASLLNLQVQMLPKYYFTLSHCALRIYDPICIDPNQKQEGSILQSEKIEPEQISSFIGGEKWSFLNFLALMIIDNHPSIQNSLSAKFQRRYLTEIFSRTFFYGLFQLREKQGLGQNDSLALRKLQIKSIYIISILLEGIDVIEIKKFLGQIDFSSPKANVYDSVSILFYEIVGKLLQNSKLLTRNVFDYLVANWEISIGLVEREFFDDMFQNFLQKSNPIPMVPLQDHNVENLKQLFKTEVSKKEKEKIVQQSSEKVQQQQEQVVEMFHESPQAFSQSSSSLDPFDYGLNFYEENSAFLNDSLPAYFYQDFSGQVSQKILRLYGLSYYPQMKQAPPKKKKICKALAQWKWNYEKQFTRDRVQYTQRKKMEKLIKSQPPISEPQPENNDDISGYLDLPKENPTPIRAIISSDQIPASTETTQIIHNETLRGQTMPQEQPYHNVPHDNREVDSIISTMIESDFAIAHYIANHIYHSLRAYKIHLLRQS